MNQRIDTLRATRQHSGSVLVTILVIAIIIVLVLMWQAGMFSGGEGAGQPTSEPAQKTQEAANSGDDGKGGADGAAESQAAGALPPEPARPKAAQLEPLERQPDGKDDASIRAVAESLLASHPVDVSACRTATDANKALDCAAAAQSTALAAVFKDYESRRAAGDLAANARGGEVLKLVVASLQEQLKPFEDAVQ